MSIARVVVQCTVNGKEVHDEVEPRTSLADFLRHQLGLYGVHVGCEQGVCGMCTILFDGRAVKSCVMLAAQAAGHEIRTVESLAADGPLHPVQEAFSEHHGLQCGYCTPGVMMTAVALAESGAVLDEVALRDELAGNLCRCTGYVNIVSAVSAFLAGDASSGDPEAQR
jgi:carbon-monoxide dehydrogenase small subunit